jgi:hypothetical protein
MVKALNTEVHVILPWTELEDCVGSCNSSVLARYTTFYSRMHSNISQKSPNPNINLSTEVSERSRRRK